MTEEEIKNCNVPTDEILGDIQDTQHEIDDYEEILKILYRNPVDNKLEIYLKEGQILNRKSLIEKLNDILEYRKKQVQ